MSIILANLLTPTKILPAFLARSALVDMRSLTPWAVEIHPTSTCNYACIHCSYNNRRKGSRKSLSDQAMRTLLDSLCGHYRPEAVYFSGGGEPTTFPLWEEGISCLARQDIACALVSNGVNLNRLRPSVLSALSYMAISIYSTVEAEYAQITKSRFFADQFIVPSLLGSERSTVIGSRCVINRVNYQSVYDTYRQALESGYDYIIFIPAVDYENRGIGLVSDEISFLLDRLSGQAIDEKRTNLHTLIKRKFSYYKKEYKPVYTDSRCACLDIRSNVFINYDGGVYTCQPHIGNFEYCLGNLEDQNFGEIWNSDRHEVVIEKLHGNWAAGKCANCRCIAYNEVIDDFIGTPPNTPISLVKDCFL